MMEAKAHAKYIRILLKSQASNGFNQGKECGRSLCHFKEYTQKSFCILRIKVLAAVANGE